VSVKAMLTDLLPWLLLCFFFLITVSVSPVAGGLLRHSPFPMAPTTLFRPFLNLLYLKRRTLAYFPMTFHIWECIVPRPPSIIEAHPVFRPSNIRNVSVRFPDTLWSKNLRLSLIVDSLFPRSGDVLLPPPFPPEKISIFRFRMSVSNGSWTCMHPFFCPPCSTLFPFLSI